MNKHFKITFSLFFSLVVFAVLTFLILNMKDGLPMPFEKIQKAERREEVKYQEAKKEIGKFKKFDSVNDLKTYLENGSAGERAFGFGGGMGVAKTMTADSAASAPEAMGVGGGVAEPARVSETNVQVVGIDEPDIVKTDGKNIYLSQENFFYGGGVMMMKPMIAPAEGDFMRPYYKGETNIIKAFPPESLKKAGKMENFGNMLLAGNILAVFSGNVIYGYDVSDAKDPKEKWKVELQDGTSLSQARLYSGKIYMVTNSNINRRDPCPIIPFAANGVKVSIPCLSIYHPDVVVPMNVTYNISTIDPATGELSLGISFLGSYDSTVYMSKNSIYVAYAYTGDMTEFFFDFVNTNKDIFPANVASKIEKLKSYDISQNAKITEINFLLDEMRSSFNSDDSLAFDNEMQNRMKAFFAKHKRDIQKTNIVKVGIENFNVDAVGSVPGRLLNQYSMDEYEGSLRAATTVGEQGFWQFGLGGFFSEPANDLYVLNGKMEKTGEVLDMGTGERIYSVRFIDDKGYLVTFKQVDPFFVVDLLDPKDPKLEGELKIPGYSSYLHPIEKDKILGVGMDGSSVKLSLFDVSDSKNPNEISKYSLDEYWSDVLNTSRAFLMDKDNKVFFIPGGKGGYLFSYENNELKLKKAVSLPNVKRAVYIDKYLYVIGSDKIIVISEDNWERVNELKMQ